MPDPLADNPPSGHAAPPDLPAPMAEPPPVRLLAIAAVTVLCPPGHEAALDRLYLDILRFHPADPALKPPPRSSFAAAQLTHPKLTGPATPTRPTPPLPRTYLAENLPLHYLPTPQLTPHQTKLIQLQVPSLRDLTQRLLDAQIPYQFVRGLAPGLVHLEITDPAGHLLQILESPLNLPL